MSIIVSKNTAEDVEEECSVGYSDTESESEDEKTQLYEALSAPVRQALNVLNISFEDAYATIKRSSRKQKPAGASVPSSPTPGSTRSERSLTITSGNIFTCKSFDPDLARRGEAEEEETLLVMSDASIEEVSEGCQAVSHFTTSSPIFDSTAAVDNSRLSRPRSFTIGESETAKEQKPTRRSGIGIASKTHKERLTRKMLSASRPGGLKGETPRKEMLRNIGGGTRELPTLLLDGGTKPCSELGMLQKVVLENMKLTEEKRRLTEELRRERRQRQAAERRLGELLGVTMKDAFATGKFPRVGDLTIRARSSPVKAKVSKKFRS